MFRRVQKAAAGGSGRPVEASSAPAGRSQGDGVGVSPHGVRGAWTLGDCGRASRGGLKRPHGRTRLCREGLTTPSGPAEGHNPKLSLIIGKLWEFPRKIGNSDATHWAWQDVATPCEFYASTGQGQGAALQSAASFDLSIQGCGRSVVRRGRRQAWTRSGRRPAETGRARVSVRRRRRERVRQSCAGWPARRCAETPPSAPCLPSTA